MTSCISCIKKTVSSSIVMISEAGEGAGTATEAIAGAASGKLS
jgi:hypothetical protein